MMPPGKCHSVTETDGPHATLRCLRQNLACAWSLALMPIFLTLCGSCAGPQPLSLAIDPRDQDMYVSQLNAARGDARQAYVNWIAEERRAAPDQILQADASISQTRNPFDSRRDAQAVSRGAVIYQVHCARCHGDDATGHGPSTLSGYPATNFKTVAKRLGATLHRGAPRKWFKVIRDGGGEFVDYPDGRMTAMPAFGDKLTREQIWLVITYLQSLDVNAAR